MNNQVICFGEILWDCFPGAKKPGGAPMNVAFHLHKQGFESALISAVGDDEDGKNLNDYLTSNGLDVQFVQTNKLPTGIVEVHLDDKGQAAYTIVQPVAWDAIEYAVAHKNLLKSSAAIVFGSLAARGEKSKATLFKLLEDAPLKVFDMNLRPPHFTDNLLEALLHRTDILKINEHELSYLEALYKLSALSEVAIFEWLSNTFAMQTICVTLGDKGAKVWHKGKLFSHLGFKIKVVDTVGAGDAFLAAFIGGLLKNEPMEKVLERACATGAVIASKAGANPEYGLGEVEELY